MPAPLLVAESLTKDYGSFRALDAFDLALAPGEVLGLLGPNGSGKTTALRMMLGFLKPTAGSASLAGFDCWSQGVEARKRVAYLPGELRLYENMTGRRLVSFLAGLRGEQTAPNIPGTAAVSTASVSPRFRNGGTPQASGPVAGGTPRDPRSEVDDLAKKLDIDIDRPLTHMSSGMKRKVALLTVLLPKVPLIILDEPTNTLDPTMRDELLDQLKRAKDRGQAVLFSSHVLQEVEAVCDRVGILRRGKLVHVQELADLRDGRTVTGRFTGSLPATAPDGTPLNVVDHRLNLTWRGPMPVLLEWLAKQQLDDLRIEPLGLAPIYKKWHGAE